MLKNLTRAERNTLTIWAIVAIVIFILVIIFKFEVGTKGYGEKVKLDKSYSIVQDYDRYYTVVTAINKYYAFINSGDTEAILKILDEGYVKDEKLNNDNVLNHVCTSKEQLTYSSSIMCQKRYAEDEVSYYVSGREKTMFNVEGDDSTIIKDDNLGEVYYNVTLYESLFVFSIKPISVKEFGDECHG